MIWSCITGDGPGPIYFVEETLRKEQYKKVLEEVLFPYMRSLPQGQSSYTFMQDGAPCHTAKLIENVLLNENIDILSWPGNSPDLNPIENCWAVLKSKVYKTPNPTVSTLKKNIDKIWRNDEIRKMINKCISSMPERIKAVIKNKGSLTKF